MVGVDEGFVGVEGLFVRLHECGKDSVASGVLACVLGLRSMVAP